MNLFIYPYHREFTDNQYCHSVLVFDCQGCPYLTDYFYYCCCDYCVFSNACLSALEMGWN